MSFARSGLSAIGRLAAIALLAGAFLFGLAGVVYMSLQGSEVQVPEIGTSVFLIPSDFGGRSEQSGVKNGEDRLVVLNDVAKSVIEAQRGEDPAWVFPYKRDRPLAKMNDTASRVNASVRYSFSATGSFPRMIALRPWPLFM